MKHKITWLLWLVVILALAVTPLVGACAPKPTEVIKWKMHTDYVEGYNVVKGYPKFVELVKEYTKGKLDIEIYYAGALGYTWKEIPQALKENLVEMAEIAHWYVPEGAGWLGINDFIFLYNNRLQSAEFAERIHPLLVETYATLGIKWLATDTFVCDAQGSPILYSTKEIKSLADIKGLKPRINAAMMNDYVFKPMGATGVMMPGGEVYMAMKTGIIDGSWGQSLDTSWMYKYYEACKYAYIVHCVLAAYPFGIACSQKSFDALPSDVQKGLEKAAREWQDWYLYETIQDPNKFGFETMLEFGEKSEAQGLTIKRLPEEISKEIDRLSVAGLNDWAGKGDAKCKEVANILLELRDKYPAEDSRDWTHWGY